MNTLSEILKNETSTAVIFGQVHRRQKTLETILVSKDWNNRTIVYEAGTVTDLIDYVFVLEFNNILTGYQFLLDSGAATSVKCREHYEKRIALEAAGIDNECERKIKWDAIAAAHKVMCRTNEDWDTFTALTSSPSDDAQLQVAA
jgi:hypothetical protein